MLTDSTTHMSSRRPLNAPRPSVWRILSVWLVVCSIGAHHVLANDLGSENVSCGRGVNGIASPIVYEPASFDVLHYDVELDCSGAPKLVTNGSRCAITFRWTQAPDTVRIHLRSLTIDSLWYLSASGERLAATAVKRGTDASADMMYVVPAHVSHRVNDTVTLVVAYSGTMTSEAPVNGMSWGGVSRDQTDAVYSLGVGFSNPYVSCTQHWMPCYDVPSDKATLRTRITCPKAYMGLSNGSLIGSFKASDTTVVFEWRMNEPCATYLMTFAVGPYFAMNFGATSRGVPVVSYGKSGDTTRSKSSFRKILRMVESFERRFVPYPFSKVGYVVTNLGSMEHQSLICLARGEIQSLSDTVNKTIAHELAHQWFGDMVTPLDFRDAWLTESFATYCESLWYEELGGRQQYFNDLKSKVNSYLTTVGKPGGRNFEGVLPMYAFPRTAPSSNYPQTIYVKGAGVLGMLRALVGDSVFFGSLRSYLLTHAYANATIDTMEQVFVDHVPQQIQDSVKDFFTQWIRGRGWPTLDVSATQVRVDGEWKTRVAVRQVQADSMGVYTWFPLELSFMDTKGTKQNRVVVVHGKDDSFSLDSLGEIVSIGINAGSTVPTLAVLTRTPIVTSVETDLSQRGEVEVFPNPTDGTVWLRVPSAGQWSAEILDVQGRRVNTVTADATADRLLFLSLHDVPAGTYAVRLTSGDRRHSVSVTRRP